MLKTSAAACILAIALASGTAKAETEFPSTLAGHALLPAASFAAPPGDAPADAGVSGKFTTGVRVHEVGTVPGDTGSMHGKRPTGISLPFSGQALQGFSGFAMDRAADGSIYVVTDNGFGSKANSPDALLFFHKVSPDFATGAVLVRETVFLRDSDRKVPFRIAYEGTPSRYLTGADFDLESIQIVNGEVWIGDEFGPYLIRAAMDGRILDVHPTMIDGKTVKSVDHPTINGMSKPGVDWTVPRSGGYEGMALQPGTGLLWAMLEKPMIGEDGNPVGNNLQVLAFDPAKSAWTGAGFKFALSEGATAIGDFNFIDGTRALVIERDNGEGDPSLKCEGEARPDCFPLPAMLKRIVLIDTAAIDADGFVRRIGHVDLMKIADPDGKARVPTDAKRDLTGIMTFPFFTIENVMATSPTQIVVAADNNLPFSSGRKLNAAADSEFILLDVPELLSAK